MGTATIQDLSAVRLTGITNLTAAADRTFTATRRLRMCDLKVQNTAAAVAAVTTVTVTNGVTPCITLTTAGGGLVQNIIYRLGHLAGGAGLDLLITAAAADLVLAGGTMVFAVDQAVTLNLHLYCFPDPGVVRH